MLPAGLGPPLRGSGVALIFVNPDLRGSGSTRCAKQPRCTSQFLAYPKSCQHRWMDLVHMGSPSGEAGSKFLRSLLQDSCSGCDVLDSRHFISAVLEYGQTGDLRSSQGGAYTTTLSRTVYFGQASRSRLPLSARCLRWRLEWVGGVKGGQVLVPEVSSGSIGDALSTSRTTQSRAQVHPWSPDLLDLYAFLLQVFE